MDTFDTIILSVFVLILLTLIALMLFWKQSVGNGQVRSSRSDLSDFVLLAIVFLTLSVNHHWNAPHRRIYQVILDLSTLPVIIWKFVKSWAKDRQKPKKKETPD